VTVIDTNDKPLGLGVIDLDRARRLKQLEAENEKLKETLATYRETHLSTGVLTPHERSYDKCRDHMSVLVDYEARKIICRYCNTEVDPILVLHEYATRERMFASRNEDLVDRVTKLRNEIELLTKQRANLRAAIRKDGGEPIDDWAITTHRINGTTPDLSAETSTRRRRKRKQIDAEIAESSAEFHRDRAQRSEAHAAKIKARAKTIPAAPGEGAAQHCDTTTSAAASSAADSTDPSRIPP